MKSASLLLLGLAFTAGCSTETPCESLCKTLVMDCEFAAYPSLDSCIEGCLYDEELGADIEGEAECIVAEQCDLIGTVDCAREFNPSAE